MERITGVRKLQPPGLSHALGFAKARRKGFVKCAGAERSENAAKDGGLSQKEVDIQMMLAIDVHLGTKNCDFQMER